jgi:hypothetical protein
MRAVFFSLAEGNGEGGKSLKFTGKHTRAECFGPESLVTKSWNHHLKP